MRRNPSRAEVSIATDRGLPVRGILSRLALIVFATSGWSSALAELATISSPVVCPESIDSRSEPEHDAAVGLLPVELVDSFLAEEVEIEDEPFTDRHPLTVGPPLHFRSGLFEADVASLLRIDSKTCPTRGPPILA